MLIHRHTLYVVGCNVHIRKRAGARDRAMRQMAGNNSHLCDGLRSGSSF